MRIAFFDTHQFDRAAFDQANRNFQFEITYIQSRLSKDTAPASQNHDVVCAFVNDCLDQRVLKTLKSYGIGLIALRSAGFNHVDLDTAEKLGIKVVRVPEYSPHAVAEHAVALILCLNRKIHRAAWRVRDSNFSLEGLVGFDLFGKTCGVIGTGRIGGTFAKIMSGFGCRVLAYDLVRNKELESIQNIEYVDLETIYRNSDIISLHVPLTPQTRHLINNESFAMMKQNVMVINTGRGALIDTRSLITALKKHRIGSAALDVYEEEEGIFFEDLSNQGIQDDTLARLLTFPNVLITSHQAFLTSEALESIASTTLNSIKDFASGKPLVNLVSNSK